MSITATELKNDLSKYLKLSQTEDVIITKNGRIVAKLVSPDKAITKSLDSLFGILPSDVNEEDIKDERIMKL